MPLGQPLHPPSEATSSARSEAALPHVVNRAGGWPLIHSHKFLMNAKELLQCAPRLSESNCAYVLFNNGDRAIIVSPGASGKKITVRACNADGVQIGPVKKVSPKRTFD